MTRFARARGSKSSNKREAEEATSWSLLKEGLFKKSSDYSSVERAEEIQKYKDTIKQVNKPDPASITWATFDEGQTKPAETKTPNEKKAKQLENELDNKEVKKGKKRNIDSPDNTNIFVKEKKAKNNSDASSSNLNNSKSLKKNVNNNTNVQEEIDVFTKMNNGDEGNNIKTKKKKNKDMQIENSQDVSTQLSNDAKQTNIGGGENQGFKKYNPPNKKVKEYKRKKPLPEPYQMDLNGEMVSVVTYDGFPILLHDAKRLEDLKKSLYAKGISNGEIKKIIKLQRRSAEKALTRARKKVCFNCRRSGHPLSECPSLNQGEGTGICFKCGSTEHTHFECKVVKKQEFKFAQCFICKEQGHISNQCPDNPRGLYPKGGACKLCGDVTHLKRFCPTLLKEAEPTIENFLDVEDSRQPKRLQPKPNPKANKHVRF